MSTGFTIGQIGNYNVDLDDILVRREIFSDGNLWGCGYNSSGQLGTNNTSSYFSPVTTVAGGTNWKSVSAMLNHTAAIKTDGTLWVWGRNTDGILGTNNISSYSSPVTTVAGGTNWKIVSTGFGHTSGIKSDGTLWVWGNNFYGQLGTNNASSYSSPVTTVAGGTNWKFVACADYSTAAIKTDGTLWVWGSNSSGQLGTNDTTSRSSPVTTVAGGTNWKTVSGGRSFFAAIKTDGTLWVWGLNNSGNLGTFSPNAQSSPITTAGANATNWKSVSCGYGHTAAIKTDGTLWVWGGNFSGQLGTNNTSSYSSPITTVAGGTNWKSVSCGANHTAAIKTDGTLWTWGSLPAGGLGQGAVFSTSSPNTVVGTVLNWKQVTTGAQVTFATTDLTI